MESGEKAMGAGGGGGVIACEVLVGLVCPLFDVVPSNKIVGN